MENCMENKAKKRGRKPMPPTVQVRVSKALFDEVEHLRRLTQIHRKERLTTRGWMDEIIQLGINSKQRGGG